ncbi:MAG: glycoside hydrolase family 43 protein [Halanaerobiaceae bacterium]
MAEGAPEIGQEEEPEFGEVGVHDPMVTEDNGTFYVFGSHLASAKSEDLLDWEQISSRVAKNNALIPDPKEELSQVLDWAQTDTLWAGSVIKLDDEQYHFYYSACVGDAPRSALGLAVADDIEGPYEHQEILLKSGMNGKSEDGKNYNANIHPNVVDPHVFYDQQGALWMVYGSYSGGIFIMEMDSETGLPLPEQGYGKKLLGGNHSRIEAPYILYNPETDYYYLFLSFGGLGSDGGYNIRVARSENPDGPYYDSQGNEMIEAQGPEGTFFEDQAIEPYGAKLIGNFEFAESGVGYVSPGHNSAYYDEETGKMYAFFHTRFPRRGERHNLRVHQMVMNSEGWPVIMPHRYAGESVESYTENEITGDYQYINHGTEITAEIRESVEISLKEDGSIAGAVEGTWEKTGDYTVDIEIEGDLYHGVVLKQWDDGLEEYVMTFSALSEKGVTIWGSQVVK